MATFTISGRLPSLNEIIRWNRIVGRFGRRRFYGSVKRREVAYHIWAYLKKAELAPFAGPVSISVKWIEPNARRDFDNISSGAKFLLDVLVKNGTIGGDSRKWIPDPVKHEFSVDKQNPRIEVTINEHHSIPGPELSRAA